LHVDQNKLKDLPESNAENSILNRLVLKNNPITKELIENLKKQMPKCDYKTKLAFFEVLINKKNNEQKNTHMEH
jgi:Leucine-rich repeat (LRR) protein